MNKIKSFSVGNGDMFYISHKNGTFTMIDCNLTGERDAEIIQDIRAASADADITRFISTHPDEDHFCGLELLDHFWPVKNFCCVNNNVAKPINTDSLKRYRELRDGGKAFYLYKGCSRAWMTDGDETRPSAGLEILWPNTSNPYFQAALADCNRGLSPNNISTVIRYQIDNGPSVMWLGDLETEFMENIRNDIELKKTTIVFAAHHGRDSGKIPNSWLRVIDPQIIVLGEAPSRHLNYYTGYRTIKQNSAGDITIYLQRDLVHFYVANHHYREDHLTKLAQLFAPGYLGSLPVEREYTL